MEEIKRLTWDEYKINIGPMTSTKDVFHAHDKYIEYLEEKVRDLELSVEVADGEMRELGYLL